MTGGSVLRGDVHYSFPGTIHVGIRITIHFLVQSGIFPVQEDVELNVQNIPKIVFVGFLQGMTQ